MKATGNDIGWMLCDAFGLDKTLVRRLVLDVGVNEVVVLTVEQLVEREGVERAVDLITQRYEVALTPIEVPV